MEEAYDCELACVSVCVCLYVHAQMCFCVSISSPYPWASFWGWGTVSEPFLSPGTVIIAKLTPLHHHQGFCLLCEINMCASQALGTVSGWESSSCSASGSVLCWPWSSKLAVWGTVNTFPVNLSLPETYLTMASHNSKAWSMRGRLRLSWWLIIVFSLSTSLSNLVHSSTGNQLSLGLSHLP